MKPREDHVGVASAQVRAKPVHYGWLLIAPPGWAAGSSSRRWQRRFFILYDIGTLSWALDDNDGTEPAGKIDLNKPHLVEKAEKETQINNTILIKSEDSAVTKVYVRSDSSEEFIFWYKSLLKMIADTKEKEKEIKRRNKMLTTAEIRANRRRHHTVSVTGTNPEVEAARRINSQLAREKRSQTIIPQSAATRRERPNSLATTGSIPVVQSSAPPTPTGMFLMVLLSGFEISILDRIFRKK